MHFDDRLTTVLRHRAAGERAAKTQFRQLLDLLGSRIGGRDQSLLAAAWLRLAALGEAIPAKERARMIDDPGLRFRNPELAAHLAEDEPEVAAAALARADLSEEDWAALIPRLPVRARGFLRFRRDLGPQTSDILERLGIQDRGLPQPEISVAEAEENRIDLDVTASAASGKKPPKPANDVPKIKGPKTERPKIKSSEIERSTLTADSIGSETGAIGALVKRIEQFRKDRSNGATEPSHPRLPLGETADETSKSAPKEFAFTCDSSGRIDWATPRLAPSLIGIVLTKGAARMAMRFRQPLRREQIDLVGAPIIAGTWVVDAYPRFTRADGQFYGYAGKFRRHPELSAASPHDAKSSEADRLRQLLHELRTPVNAIQGFSEVIQQQLFGPAPHEYRALAAGIAGDSARMLAGFEELDRLARLETGALDIETGQCDFGAIVSGQIGQLQTALKPKTAEFGLRVVEPSFIAVTLADAEALAWRLLATIAASVGAGEHIHIELAEHGGALRLCCALPATLSGKTDIFATTMKPASGALSAGMFGAGFALRLARAEARAATGDLVRVDDWLMLSLPLLTTDSSAPSAAKVNGAI